MTLRSKKILVIYYSYDPPEKMRLAIQHHLRALKQSSTPHHIVYHNTYTAPYWELNDQPETPPSSIQQTDFDAVILHNSFLCLRWTGWNFYKLKQRFDWIRRIEAPKIAIPQDEGDHAGLLDEWLFEWGVQAVLTVHHDNTGDSPLYPRLRRRARFYRCFPGYIDEQSAEELLPKLVRATSRSLDIVYRATHLPYWFGSAGQRKHRVAERAAACAKELGLHSNISTNETDAILGANWLDFLMSGRATIGCEGGSSVLDWYGEVRGQIQALLADEPHLSFEVVSAHMPTGWDNYSFLTITPRHFEAIITKTCQVLVEGDYRGVLKANLHYLPIKRDFSNLDQILKKLRDKNLVNDIVEQAYTDIYLSKRYTYRTFAELIDHALAELDKPEIHNGVIAMSHENQARFALEQELISERHNGFLLQAKTQETVVRLNRLEIQLQVAQRCQDQLTQEKNRLENELRVTQEQLTDAKRQFESPLVLFAYAARKRWITVAALACASIALWSFLIAAFTVKWIQ